MKILVFKNTSKFVVISAPADDLVSLFVVSFDDENPPARMYTETAHERMINGYRYLLVYTYVTCKMKLEYR